MPASRRPRLFLLFTPLEGPSGGGNQFMKALQAALMRKDALASTQADADAFLFASYHGLARAAMARLRRPQAVFIHRVDGPIRLYNRMDDPRDAKVAAANRALADATVFQSRWSRDANVALGWPQGLPDAVIPNAPDAALFHPPAAQRAPGPRRRVIAASWSANENKGFDVYAHLDATLDFSRWEMAFVGNSPCKFERVTHVPPLPSDALAEQFRESDVFLTASRKDPASNTLVEALACGLPAVARNDGGHPEIVGRGGLLFDRPEEVPALLDRAWSEREALRAAISVPAIDDVAAAYVDFAASLVDARDAGRLRPRRLGIGGALRLFREARA
ncbi:MAG: glycosyltransferase family 4 protein [Alphaproteobacteria bacterium]|nr:glycosyltransferase family 4 protein [Alphaproteobacteria bacterium]